MPISMNSREWPDIARTRPSRSGWSVLCSGIGNITAYSLLPYPSLRPGGLHGRGLLEVVQGEFQAFAELRGGLPLQQPLGLADVRTALLGVVLRQWSKGNLAP